MSDQLHDAVAALVGNPFAAPKAELLAAEEVLSGSASKEEVRRLIARGRIIDAKRFVLAVGHAAARRSSEEGKAALDEKAFPSRLLAELPRSRAEYRRITLASGRCYRALTSLAGSSSAMRDLRKETWAACFGHSLHHGLALERVIIDHDVLFLGETGTGKEKLAHAVREGTPGGRDGGPAPYAAINAAAVPETLIESELFGHEKGAFTGADQARGGRIRSANGGCFFLDEVGDLRPSTQVKLLRIMETNLVSPLGSDSVHDVDLRWVAATHKDLAAMVEAGEFRRDLYQRLAGHVIEIPPLRERLGDIPEIGRAFVQTYLPEGEFEDVRESIDRFLARAARGEYAFAGNVRELQNALRSLMLGVEPVLAGDKRAVLPSGGEALPSVIAAGEATMRQVGDWYLRRVLDATDDNYAQASRLLAMDRATVRRRARRLAETKS